LRIALKVLSRIDEETPKMQSAGRMEEMDDLFEASALARALAGFTASPLLGERLP
jgi:hypothetical protein